MKQSTIKILAEQRDIRGIADHFVNTNIKVKKTDVSSKLKDGILPAGTVVDKNGKPATGVDAFGILFEDIDFKNSSETEIIPVLIHGFVSKSKIKEYCGEELTEDTIKALNLIKFI